MQLVQGLTNNKPDFRIQVKGLFGTEEKMFEVVGESLHELHILVSGQDDLTDTRMCSSCRDLPTTSRISEFR